MVIAIPTSESERRLVANRPWEVRLNRFRHATLAARRGYGEPGGRPGRSAGPDTEPGPLPKGGVWRGSRGRQGGPTVLTGRHGVEAEGE